MQRLVGGRSRASFGAVAVLLLIGGLFFFFQRSGTAPAPARPADGNGAYDVYFTEPVAQTAQSYRGGPDEELARAIESAKISVDVAAYAFDLWSIQEALIAAHHRGLRVRMVVESDNLLVPEVEALVQEGIPVLGDRREPLMHHKFAVIDGQEVWTGSMNLTLSSAYHDHNNLLRLRSPEIAQDFTREFEEMFAEDRFGQLSLKDTPYPGILLDGRRVEVLFSPDDEVVERILEQIGGATSSIDVLAYVFTSNDIAEALLERAAAGVVVRGVLDGGQAMAAGGEYARLRQAGLDVRLYQGEGIMHHKVIVVDQAVVITGSYNFTRSAEEYNDEAVLVLHDPDLASWFLAEFDRLYQESE